jgi:hypothetical protein
VITDCEYVRKLKCRGDGGSRQMKNYIFCSFERVIKANRRNLVKLGEEEMTGVWRKLHNEELHKLYSSPSITRMIKSRI